jgi:N-acetylglutamate synthase-like GNAT family acetyltransferase
MLTIEPAQNKDAARISEILKRLDLYHPSRIPDDFWVAQMDNKIVGVACLTEHDDFFFLSSVGVLEEHQRKGIAKALLEKIFKDLKKDVYLYTIIPGFFKKFRFEIVERRCPTQDVGHSPPHIPGNLPSKESLGCENCLSDNCVCMIKGNSTCNKKQRW